jgi:cell division protein FtsB
LYFAAICCTVPAKVPKAGTRSIVRKKKAPRKPSSPGRTVGRWVILIIIGMIVLDALVGDRGLMATLRARREYHELARTIANQRIENARLADQAKRLRDDPRAIEEVARRELGLIRPGEKVFILKNVGPPKDKP